MHNQEKLKLIYEILNNLESGLGQVKKLLARIEGEAGETVDFSGIEISSSVDNYEQPGEIIEGVFDGKEMIGSDGNAYPIPENYSSKSKLVEGDILKLTIKEDSSYLYKQIKPIEREMFKGILAKDKETQEYRVLVDDKLYRVLGASVSYFKGNPGDDVVLVVPVGGASKWGAIENISPKQYNESVGLESNLSGQELLEEDDLNLHF